MPKQIYRECTIHFFLVALRRIAFLETNNKPRTQKSWQKFISSLDFELKLPYTLVVKWTYPQKRRSSFEFDPTKLYFRGDSLSSHQQQQSLNLTFAEDKVKAENDQLFNQAAIKIIAKAGYKVSTKTLHRLTFKETERMMTEEEFHDGWAQSMSVDEVDPVVANEIITAPEMRYIHKVLGNVRGKRVLDVGSGLGEVGIYFAMKGARVTLTDISQGMLVFSQKLAKKYGVKVEICQSSVENLDLGKVRFDVIYVGNLFHHVNIDQAIRRLKPYLKARGVMVSKDPLAYNPIINIYRNIAVHTRSKDEHPIVLEDIKIFRKHFRSVKTEWFWLTTLVIFIIMAIVQRRNPNRERYWKKVEEEGANWAWIYRPLERFDQYLLKIFPVLRVLCWNVAIVCRSPR